MTNVMSLDDLRKKADEEYAPYRLTVDDSGKTLTIRNPIRLKKDDREHVSELTQQLQDVQELLDSEDESINASDVETEVHEIMLDILHTCADDDRLADILNDALREDFGLTQITFFDWFGVDEVGEASNSPAE